VCVKSSTLNLIWPEHMFISGGSPHLTSQFCKDKWGCVLTGHIAMDDLIQLDTLVNDDIVAINIILSR